MSGSDEIGLGYAIVRGRVLGVLEPLYGSGQMGAVLCKRRVVETEGLTEYAVFPSDCFKHL